MPKIPKMYLYAGGAVLALLLINSLTRKNGQSLLASTGEAITGGVIGSAADLVTGAAAGVIKQISPMNNQNIIYQGVNKIGGAVANKPSFDLGVWLYDLTHDEFKL